MKCNGIFHICKILILLVCLQGYSCKTVDIITRSSKSRVSVREIDKWHADRENNLNTVWIKKIGGSIIWNKKEESFKASYKVKRDSIILISLMNPLGIEAVRIFCTVDTFGFIDRINRNYYKTDYNALKRRFGFHVDYFLIQSLLLNEIPKYSFLQSQDVFNNTRYLEVKNYTCVTNYILTESNQEGKSTTTNYTVEFDPDYYFILKAHISNNNSPQKIELLYENHRLLEPVPFPETIEINIQASQFILYSKLKLDRVAINTDFNTPHNINPNYNRIDW